MNTVVQRTGSDIRSAARAITARYVSAASRETESAIALLTLWTLDAIEAGRLSREDATDIFTELDVSVGDECSGPDLSERAHELMLEGGWFHDDAIGAGPDFQQLRRIAFEILGQAGR
jgi:hypothetical protein